MSWLCLAPLSTLLVNSACVDFLWRSLLERGKPVSIRFLLPVNGSQGRFQRHDVAVMLLDDPSGKQSENAGCTLDD